MTSIMDKFIAIATAPCIVAQISLHPCLQPQTQANPALVTDPLFAVTGRFRHIYCSKSSGKVGRSCNVK